MPIPDVFKEMKVGDALDILFGLRPDPRAEKPPAEESPTHEGPMWLTRNQRPRTFALNRRKDHSGVSGVGYVATGVQFPDGTVAVRWFGKDPSTSLCKSMDALEAVHGHGGSTQIEWLD